MYERSGGVGFLGLLFLLFLGLKLTGWIGWSWWWVSAPLWVPFVLTCAVVLALLALAGLAFLAAALIDAVIGRRRRKRRAA